ncbi:MAG: CDP-diacylglycerol--serine O-phosphatidyltransferase [Kiritimatiellae bacterium]|nr:CDP-diacylglycerol--serine O-phosphatidyltransferase [Kiritimatiellia bacterium]
MAKIRFRKRKHKRRVPREIPVRTMVPNIVTMMAAASGVTSIRYSCNEQWRYAVIAIFIACVLDGLDGRVARMLRATSRLGAELDSLADFVSFGVAPAILVYFWIMQAVTLSSRAYHFRGMFWAFALFYAMCAAFRLARFNIMTDGGPTQPYWKHFFMGLPAPGGAGLVITPVIWQLHTGFDFLQTPWVGCLMLLTCGVLMACRWPTVSIKSLRVPASRMIPFLLLVMFVIGMLISQFMLTLGVIGVIYFLSIPCSGYAFLRLRRRYEAQQTPPIDAAQE